MLVDLFASQPHYADHLTPIWAALPEHVRGQRWAHASHCWWGARRPLRAPVDRLTLVAGWPDARRLAPAPVVYVEHGAGQTYIDLPHGTDRHYSGGDHVGSNVVGYICPSSTVAGRWGDARPAVAVGAPRLDQWHLGPSEPAQRAVAVTWHWNCRLVPETRPAWLYYKPAMRAIVNGWKAAGWTVLGHGHPRNAAWQRHQWTTVGVTWASYDQVMRDAAVLIADNTSMLYEFASLDRPVVALNAPWFRRDVNHGMRFWDLVPGVQLDTPAELAAFDLDDYVGNDPTVTSRRAAVAEVYAHADGQAARRAAEFVTHLIGASP